MLREHYFSLLAALIACLTAFILVEAYVRIVVDDGMQFDLEMWKYARDVKRISQHPLRGHEHAPNREARLMGVDFRTNSRGLRDRNFDYDRTPKTNRVLMLGDSLTLGWGVPVEDTFSKRIERMFSDQGVTAEIINAGVGNYNTIQEVEFFLTEGYKYKPDIVVLNFFVNDAEPLPQSNPPSLLARNCYSCVFVAGRVDTLLRSLARKKDWFEYYLDLYGHGSAPGWLASKASLQKLIDHTKNYNIKLLVASLPELHDVNSYKFQLITDLVKAVADSNGVPFVDILGQLKDQPSEKLWVTPPDPHPNAYANAYIAKGLFEALQRLM